MFINAANHIFNQLKTNFKGLKLSYINKNIMKLVTHFWTYLPLYLMKRSCMPVEESELEIGVLSTTKIISYLKVGKQTVYVLPRQNLQKASFWEFYNSIYLFSKYFTA